MVRIKLGMILVADLGCTMTLPTFYKVTKVTAKTCTLQELQDYMTEDDGYGQSGMKMPDTDRINQHTKAFTATLGDGMARNRSRRVCAHIWDGTPQYFNYCD